jgi:hypothetical protein
MGQPVPRHRSSADIAEIHPLPIMNPNKRLVVFVVLLALVVSALVLQRVEIPDASQRLRDFPKSGLGFSSQSLRLTDFEEDAIGEANAFKAIYHWKGRSYAVTLIDGTRDRHAVHDPRYCFRGAGWNILGESSVPCIHGQATRLRLRRDGSDTEALFFYSDGVRSFDDPIDYWLRATKRRWLRRWGGPEPLLVMVQPVNPGSKLEPFLQDLLPALSLP